ncbi:DJ-1/PfpI family protein [Phenylobacterium sp.]|uniref:DJ-1/PfpI family protein n=1 Tax=Phenylobacterium sp. TaxID=1871053 RepID=UPI002810BBC1|nr:DJ-1/PfpI family protein [Phenylobacterium sp.]
MDRRKLILGASLTAAGALGSAAAAQRLRARDGIKVAFLLGENANVIDTAGPWEVFQDTMGSVDGRMAHFELFTVAPTADPVRMTGGLVVKPTYALADAPQPNVIVVPAQRSAAASLAWLKSASEKAELTLSICTGAFQLGRAGLLDGLTATTHHEFWDSFEKEFPKVKLQRGLRFVDNGRIATAGGLTSGIDLALHVVGRYFGEETAARTAAYMEHQRVQAT